MSIAAYTPGTVLGSAYSRRAPAFGVLAPGLLGMDWLRGGVWILLCNGLSYSADGTQGGRYAVAARPRTKRILGKLTLEASDQARDCFCVWRGRVSSEFHLRSNEKEV